MGFELGLEKNNLLGNGIRNRPFMTLFISNHMDLLSQAASPVLVKCLLSRLQIQLTAFVKLNTMQSGKETRITHLL